MSLGKGSFDSRLSVAATVSACLHVITQRRRVRRIIRKYTPSYCCEDRLTEVAGALQDAIVDEIEHLSKGFVT